MNGSEGLILSGCPMQLASCPEGSGEEANESEIGSRYVILLLLQWGCCNALSTVMMMVLMIQLIGHLATCVYR